MKSFKEFIGEESNIPVKNFSYYLHYAEYIPEKNANRREKFKAALVAFDEGLNNKEIYNAEFKDHYTYGLSLGLETIAGEMKGDMYKSPEDGSWIDYPMNPIQTSAAFVKQTVPMLQVHKPELAKFYMDMVALKPLVKELKGYIVKGKKPSASAKAAPFIPHAKYDTTKVVANLLSSAVDKIRSSYEREYRNIFASDINKLKTLISDEISYQKAYMTVKKYPVLQQEFLRLVTRKTDGSFEMAASATIQGYIAKRAKDTVDDILAQFIAKNTVKIAAIFDRKNKMIDHKIIEQKIGDGGILNNTMYFKFDDGSYFTIYTKTIIKSSKFGKMFYQFPSRFMNVMLANGNKMSQPSEEKMKKEF